MILNLGEIAGAKKWGRIAMGEKHASACVACKMLAYGNCMCAREVCLLGSCDCGFEKCARAFCFFLCVYLLLKLNNFSKFK